MARTKNAIVNLVFSIVALFAASCADDLHMEKSVKAPTQEPTPVDYEPLDSSSVVVNYNDGTKDWNVQHRWTLEAEDTVRVMGTEAFKAAELLSKKAQDEVMFGYNYGKINTVKVGGLAMVYKGKTIYPKDPSNMLVKGDREVVTEVAKPYYELSATNYSLVYGSIRLASARQMFIVDEGYVPSFYSMEWNAWHFGPATASYANGEAIVQCPDSLHADELWDNGEYKNPLRKLTHSKNTFSVAVSGTEVSSLSAVVGKDLTVSGNKASVAEFTVTVNRTSKEIVEKSVPYTYNGKSINFVDSLHACGYKLKGGKVISKTNVRIIFVRENGTDEVSVDVPVNITEKVRLVRTDSTFVHFNYVSTVTPNGTNLPVLSNHTVTFENVYSNGTKSVAGKVNYLWTNNYSISYNSNMMVDDLNSVLGRHTVNSNGSVTVAGYNFTVSFVNRVCDDIMYNGKNYKSYAPVCKAKVVAITINKTSLVVEFQGDHDGDNSVIKATLPVNITEKPHNPDFPGKIVWGGATDSYVDGANVATWEGTYMHFIVENNGTYKVYSRKVGTNGWSSTDVSAAYVATISNSRAVAYIGNTAAGYSLGSCQWQDQGSWTKIVYFDYNGGVARVISEISKTIGGESSNNCRMPLRGTWANGKITVDGTTYTVTGSEG